ncbi:methylmalonyl Co-A mutase-associated GTPase MeaB [Anoxybacter fermentans]|nr:methylmalonyl Co-A mutase-associated GTPase MeaB [Anoxybacter fermentans]
MNLQNMVQGVIKGQTRAIAKAISLIERESIRASDLLRELFPHTGKAYLVGITGPPGAGKSTLTNQIVKVWRKQGKKVGVIAVDPTSPFSGGAILGDRIRMNDLNTDPGVFIRSLASRGSLGGLSPAVYDTALILDAAGFEYIIIETVGVGQTEVEIVELADTTVVVTVPEAGDDIQTFKAGIMEIGDLFVVNKGDRPGTAKMKLLIENMLDLVQLEWRPPVLVSIADKGEGIEEIVDQIERHHQYLAISARLAQDRKKALIKKISQRLHNLFQQNIISKIFTSSEFDQVLTQILKRESDPFTEIDRLVQKYCPWLYESNE